MYQIHYTHHNFGDWAIATYHMSHQQKGIFDTLKMLYFGNAGKHNGKLDASDFDLLCRQAGCYSESEISDLQLLLKEQFKKNGKNYRRASWDKEISDIVCEIAKNNERNAIRNGKSNATVTQNVTDSNTISHTAPMSEAERQARHRDKQKKIKALLDNGVSVPDGMNYDEFITFYHAHFPPNDNNTITTTVMDSNETGNESNAQKGWNNNNHNHNHNHNQESENSTTPPPSPKSKSKTQKTKTPTPAFDPMVFLQDNEVDTDTATAFVKYKKSKLKKGEDITKTMLVLIQNQAGKTGKITFSDALKIIMATGKWQSFEADWNWQAWYEAVLIQENRPIPEWLKSQNSHRNPKQNPTTTTKFGTPADPLAINQHWQDYEPPANSEQNYQIAMAMLADGASNTPIGMIHI